MTVTSQKGFSGLDERVTLQNTASSASVVENFRITDGGSLAKRPEIFTVRDFGSQISGIWCGNLNGDSIIIVAASGSLYRLPLPARNSKPSLIGTIGDGDCLLFEFNGFIYIKTPFTYQKYDGVTLSDVEGYIPIVAMNCTAEGGGEPFEQINLICDKRRQLISPDGKSTVYRLVEDGITAVVSVLIDGKESIDGVMFESEKRSITFINAPPEGINTVEVTYQKPIPISDRERIMLCTQMMLFGGNSDGRAFFWGNPDHPNCRFHSDLANGVPSVEYFPVNAYTVIGNTPIQCIVQQYDRQLIFTRNEAFYSYSDLRTDALGNVYSSFPVFSLNGSKGCLFETKGCVIDNRPVTLCDDGINLWESTSVLNEKNAVCISQPIRETLFKILKYGLENPKIFDFQANRELYFVNADRAYVYNYGNGSWYSYTDFKCEHYSVYGDSLYMSFGSILYMLSNANSTISTSRALWKSASITNGHNSGLCDIVGFCADIFVRGEVSIVFGFVNEKGLAIKRSFSFREVEDRFLRISFRPSVKRTMPFRLTCEVNGSGECALHGVSIKTREKERSRRYGIL